MARCRPLGIVVTSTAIALAIGASLQGCASSPRPEAAEVHRVQPPVAQPMLEGYCPVALVEARQLEMGDPGYQSEFRGEVYQMVNKKSQDMFDNNPLRYVPPARQYDPVIFAASGERQIGAMESFVIADDRAWFFVGDQTRSTFTATPDRFTSTSIPTN